MKIVKSRAQKPKTKFSPLPFDTFSGADFFFNFKVMHHDRCDGGDARAGCMNVCLFFEAARVSQNFELDYKRCKPQADFF